MEELSTHRVLVQELAQGRSWSEALEAPAELRDQWGEAIFRFIYGSFSRLGLVHADPHPGNYVFHEDGGVSFLDFGCVKRFTQARVAACQATFRAAYVEEDALGTWRAGVEAELWNASDPVTPEEVFLLWRELRGYLCEQQPLTLTPERVAKYIERCSPNGPLANAVRSVSASPRYAMMPRIEAGTACLLARLHATNDWRAIADSEWFNVERAPLTEMGIRHRTFFEERAAASGPR